MTCPRAIRSKTYLPVRTDRIVADAMDDKRERRFYQRLETLEDRLTFIGGNSMASRMACEIIANPLIFQTLSKNPVISAIYSIRDIR